MNIKDIFNICLAKKLSGGGSSTSLINSLVDKSITSINCSASSVGSNAFYGCTELETGVFPNAVTVENNAFSGCSKLQLVDFGSAESFIQRTFSNCSNLDTIIIRTNSVCVLDNRYASLSTTKFGVAGGDIGGKLYVPQALVSDYENDSGWAYMLTLNENNQILAIEGSIYK